MKNMIERSQIRNGSEGRSATSSDGVDTVVARSKTATIVHRTPPGGNDKVPSSRRLTTATERPASRSRSTTPTQRDSLSKSSRGRSKVPTAPTATARSRSATPTQRRAATATTPAKMSKSALNSRKTTPKPRPFKAGGDEGAIVTTPKPAWSRLSPPTSTRGSSSKGRLQGSKPSTPPLNDSELLPNTKKSPKSSPSISQSMYSGSKKSSGKPPLISHSSSMPLPRSSSMGRGSTSTRSKSPSAFEARKAYAKPLSQSSPSSKAKDKTKKRCEEPLLEKAKEDEMVTERPASRSRSATPAQRDYLSKSSRGRSKVPTAPASTVRSRSATPTQRRAATTTPAKVSKSAPTSRKTTPKPRAFKAGTNKSPKSSPSISQSSIDSGSKKSSGKPPLISHSSSMPLPRSSSMGRGSTSTRSKSPSAFEARKAYARSLLQFSSSSKAKDKTKNKCDEPTLEKAKEDEIMANNNRVEVNEDGDGDEMTLHEEMHQGQEPVEVATTGWFASAEAEIDKMKRMLEEGFKRLPGVTEGAKAERGFLADAVRARKKQAEAEALGAVANTEEESREAVGLGDKDPLLNKHFSHYATTEMWEEPKETKPVLSSSFNAMTEKQKELSARKKEAEDVSRRQTKVQDIRDKVKASQAMREKNRKKISQAQLRMSEAETDLEYFEEKAASPFVHEAEGNEVTNTKYTAISDEKRALTEAVAVAANAKKEEELANTKSATDEQAEAEALAAVVNTEEESREAVGLGDKDPLLNKHFSHYATADKWEEPKEAKPVLSSSSKSRTVE